MPKLTAASLVLALLTLIIVQPEPIAPRGVGASRGLIKPASRSIATTSDFTLMAPSLPGVHSGNTAWGDYNNDGKLDVALVGEMPNQVLTTTVYAGNGMGSFAQDASANFTGTGISNIAWGNYNNDGNLDLLHTGDDAMDRYVASVYRGDGLGGFPEDNAANLATMIGGGVAWGDFNNDGIPDVLMSGSFLQGGSGIRVYIGDRQGHFTLDTHFTTGTTTGKVAVADFNHDGNLDFVVGADLGFVVQVYQGDGHGGFTLDPAALPATNFTCVAWGDYNNDGNLDLLISGRTADSHWLTQVFAGDGAGGFALDAQASLDGTESGSCAWGDYNNDGKLDILITGIGGNGTTTISKVYAGDGQGGFSEDTLANLIGVEDGSATWGDFNNDGRLDILANGYSSTGITTTVYRNDTNSPANQPPTAPSGLSATLLATDTVQLAWQPASDDHTPTVSLSYNLRVGTAPGGSDVVNPMADTSSGQRRLPALGNAQLNRAYTLTALNPNTTYYWSVQAIDNGYMGGPFAVEGSFMLGSLATVTPTPTGAISTPTTTTVPATNTPTTAAPTSTPTSTATPTNTTTTTPTTLPAATATHTIVPPTASPTAIPPSTPTDCPNPFTDVNGDVFYGAIHYLACRSMVNGTDASHYAPAGTASRGQFAKVVVLGFGLPLLTPPDAQSFSDVPPSYFAYLYIESGYHAGILSGFDAATCAAYGLGNPCYLPNLPITRGQLTKLVVNAGHYALYTPTAGQDFVDVPPSNVFYVAIETAYHSGLVNGYPGHLFLPNNNIRRDEMAQIVYSGIINQP